MLDVGGAATAASIDGIALGAAAEDAAVQAAIASSLAEAEPAANQHSGGEGSAYLDASSGS